MNTETMQHHLATIETIFAPYHPTFPLEASPTITEAMHTRLEHDTEATLPVYLLKAMTMWGTVDDFKGLLPQILRMLVFDAGRLWSSDYLFDKLAYAEFDNWPEPEQAAINHFLDDLWGYILAAYPQPDCMTLTEFIRDVPQPEHYLAIWETRLDERPALRHLADFIDVYFGAMWAGYSSIGLTPVHNVWTVREAMQARLEKAHLHYADHDFAQDFTRAAEHLHRILWRMDDECAAQLGLTDQR